MRVFELPDGRHVEVFGRQYLGRDHFRARPVIGFAVRDLSAAAGELRKADVDCPGTPARPGSTSEDPTATATNSSSADTSVPAARALSGHAGLVARPHTQPAEAYDPHLPLITTCYARCRYASGPPAGRYRTVLRAGPHHRSATLRDRWVSSGQALRQVCPGWAGPWRHLRTALRVSAAGYREGRPALPGRRATVRWRIWQRVTGRWVTVMVKRRELGLLIRSRHTSPSR